MDELAREDGEREARGRRDLERLRAIARLFDQAFGIPGTRWRFGIDALFGLVPGLGDVIHRLMTAVFDAQTANPYEVEIKRAEQRILVSHLMELANTGTPAAVLEEARRARQKMERALAD